MEKILKDVVDAWGYDSQIDMMIEEMSELTKALLKLKRNSKKPKKEQVKFYNHVCEEIADVNLMIKQMKYIFSSDMINKYEKEKLERLQDRLDDYNKNK